MDGPDSSTLFSRRLLKRKIKVFPQQLQKCIENYTENIENNTNISNTRPTDLLSQKEQQKSKYFSYEELVFPSNKNSLTQLHRDNMQVNTKESKDNDTNVLSPNNLTLRLEENIIQYQQKDVSERAESTSLKVAQKDQKGNWFEEIKKMCFNLVKKINVFKMITKNEIVKDHWKEDSTTKCCSFCHRKFTMFFRKHHCRICGNIYCSSCSSGRTLLDPNVAMPVQFVAAATSNKNVEYDRNSREFEFDGFEYNYLDYEEVDQEQQEQQRQSDSENEHWDYQQQKQKYEFDFELGHDYEREQYQIEQEFDDEFDDNENYTDGYFIGEYSITNSSVCSSDFNSFTDDDDDSSTVNNNEIEERNKDGVNYGSEPVRGRVCINCHKVFELDEKDWCCN